MLVLKSTPFTELASASNRFDADSANKKIDLMKVCSQRLPERLSEIRLYHDTLLFMIAYPDNESVLSTASNGMAKLCDGLLKLPEGKKEQLANSGIAFLETQGTFSFLMMQWLVDVFPGEVTIHSFDDAGLHPKMLLAQALDEMEFELSGAENLSKIKWLESASGSKDKKIILKWLLNAVAGLPLSVPLKEQLFESLKLYISIRTGSPYFSRSFGTIDTPKYFFHDHGLLKKFNEQELISKPLPPSDKLSPQQKSKIWSSARIALALLNRETDPVTYGIPNGIKCFNLEHGLSIALFTMSPEIRMPIESYVGFMMFKNGRPMAYGGAWLFGKRSLIGLNIFEAFRGGESAFVFAQLLRTYRQAFGAEQFEVEPYQFGKNNPEGLKSGAFWFYHRFGFRPLDKKLAELAEAEHSKILSHKGYRSPISVLKQFTASNLGVSFNAGAELVLPAQISQFISKCIAKDFAGDRLRAQAWSSQLIEKTLDLKKSELSGDERIGVRKLTLFAGLCLNLEAMTRSDKKKLLQLMKLKGTDEFAFARASREFSFEKHLVKTLLSPEPAAKK